MKSATPRQRYKSLRIMKEELSLPVIPQNAALYVPRTSQSHKNRIDHKKLIESIYSPEQDHLHDQVRTILKNMNKHPEKQQQQNMGKKKRPKKARISLPKIEKTKEMSIRQIRQQAQQMVIIERCQNESSQNFWDNIKHKSEFVQQYFKQLKKIAR